MPRRLPWADKGNHKPQVKQPVKPRPRESCSDDDSFRNTVLEKNDSDQRAPSSSPPPVAELPPDIEFMDSGVNKFDLRDDEWIMVEDEFLQTAKLFTRHLHLAEYERMKSTIDEKKSNISRPVVLNATPSSKGKFALKAEEQTKAQQRALEDVDIGLLKTARKPVKSAPAHDSSDSDDLDAPRKRVYKGTDLYNDKPLNHSKPPHTNKPSNHARPPNTDKSPISINNNPPTTPVPTLGRSRARDLWSEVDDSVPKRTMLSKETSNRLAKRKADREAQKKAKKPDVEIPTFMF
ncbi:hypothetical protein DM02DRAFT_607946 [Periconia macrospinosa]|uniref:Uncharacterized protein n=1 Tax=Periconia macrospinosa TaxID=97972 RepID=A0A2V1ED57_9PLEO|nr:hypothetical protein DM02DRAFT_607946 [Periconia macrospinosa]